MKTKLQHLLHPLNLWCRLKGNFVAIFRLYEVYCWQPFLRKWLNNGVEEIADHSTSYGCERCDKAVGKVRSPVAFWAYSEHYSFCSLRCRDEWLQILAEELKVDLSIIKAA
jgi:endogenous inhibitor of DNA gyrase (YacG/DUF329 family)